MPTATKDLYEVLGVDRNASDSEIKKAYRRRARELHPDVNKSPNAEDEFKELNEAYDVLSDPSKKAQYDRFGTIPGAAGGGSGYVDFEDIFGGGFGGMGDIFSSFFSGFGGSSQRQVRKDGRDMGIGLKITLEEAAKGTKKELVYDRLAPCPDCDSTGLGPDGKAVKCPECNGTGRVVTVQRTFLGDMQSAQTCPQCNGTGESVEGACEECGGQGRIPDRQRVSVEIPAGIHDGQQLRVPKFGEAGLQGAPAGDLIVTIRMQPHEYYERDGDDLHVQIDISMVQAALGSTVLVDGILEGEDVKVKVPHGTQNGDVVRAKGFGMPKVKSDSRGDLYAHITVSVPKKLSKKERELLEKLAEEMGEDYNEVSSPLQKLRDAFN